VIASDRRIFAGVISGLLVHLDSNILSGFDIADGRNTFCTSYVASYVGGVYFGDWAVVERLANTLRTALLADVETIKRSMSRGKAHKGKDMQWEEHRWKCMMPLNRLKW
jgi:hypothetical protein